MNPHLVREEWRRRRVIQRLPGAIGILALVVSWGCGQPPAPKPAAVAEATADQKLRQMFATLTQAQQLTFKATRQLDAALVAGSPVAESTNLDVAVSRPRMVWARSVSDTGVRRFFADGQRVSVLDERMNLYASELISGTIDEVVDILDDRYGFNPPLADFILNDPYRRFGKQIVSTTDKGIEPINGVECDHLRLSGEVADADLWVSHTDHLPRRFVAMFKDREGRPQMTVDFLEWNLAATPDASLFAFTPPKDAEKITMVGTDTEAK